MNMTDHPIQDAPTRAKVEHETTPITIIAAARAAVSPSTGCIAIGYTISRGVEEPLEIVTAPLEGHHEGPEAQVIALATALQEVPASLAGTDGCPVHVVTLSKAAHEVLTDPGWMPHSPRSSVAFLEAAHELLQAASRFPSVTVELRTEADRGDDPALRAVLSATQQEADEWRRERMAAIGWAHPLTTSTHH